MKICQVQQAKIRVKINQFIPSCIDHMNRLIVHIRMYRQIIAQVDLKNRRHRRTQIIRPRKIRVMTVMLAQLDQAMDK